MKAKLLALLSRLNNSYAVKILLLSGVLLGAALLLTPVAFHLLSQFDSAPEVSHITPPSTVPPVTLPFEVSTEQSVAKAEVTAAPITTPKYRTIELRKANTLVFRNTVTDSSAGQLISKAYELSRSLSPNDTIYLVIDSPGGSISAGNDIIDALKGLPQKVDTITMFSASMAAFMVEKLGKRYMTPSGTIMFHQASIGGLSGSLPDQVAQRLRNIIYGVEVLEKEAAKRMGISHETYKAAIDDELWLSGDEAKLFNAVDEVVYLRCGKDLNETYKQKISFFVFSFELEFSTCPLLSQPIEKAKDARIDITIQQYIDLLFGNKPEFVKKYIVTGDYARIERQRN